jgi:hypothetical protein
MQKDFASAWNYRCSFHLEVFRVSYFPQGTYVLLLANSSKDNTRVELERVEMDSYGSWVFWIDKLYFYLLTSGTRLQLVCQSMSVYGSTPYLDMGDYKGWIGLSPPAAYPSTGGYEANEGSL